MEENILNDFLLRQNDISAQVLALQQKRPSSYEEKRMQVVRNNGLPNFNVENATKPQAQDKNA